MQLLYKSHEPSIGQTNEYMHYSLSLFLFPHRDKYICPQSLIGTMFPSDSHKPYFILLLCGPLHLLYFLMLLKTLFASGHKAGKSKGSSDSSLKRLSCGFENQSHELKGTLVSSSGDLLFPSMKLYFH